LTCDDGVVEGSSWSGGLFSVEQVAGGLVDAGSVYGFLAEHGAELFAEELSDLFAAGVGRPSVPASVVGPALVLQALTGCSDRQAADSLTFDLRWKAACGVGVDERGFHYSVLCCYRRRIAASDRPDRVFDLVARLVAGCGALTGRTRRVTDSTVVADAVARQDTYQLLVWQVHRVRALFPELADWVDCLPGRAWYADRSRPQIDWADPAAREDLVSVLVGDALRIVQRAEHVLADRRSAWDRAETARAEAEGHDPCPWSDPVAVEAVGLLALLAGQDVEPAEGSDGTDGRWRIARKVAEERVISTVDTQARHARKTRAHKVDGFKAHVLVEPDTGLVVQACLTSAAGPGSSDAAVGAQMVADDPGCCPDGPVTAVLGDSAYDAATMHAACDTAKVACQAKARPLHPAVPGGFTLDDFEVITSPDDPHSPGRVRCPGGHTVPRTAKGRADFTARCGGCVVREQCTTAAAGRVVTIGTDQLRSRAHRRQVAAPDVKADQRRHRPMVERTIARMVAAGRRVPYRGTTKNNAWWKLRAATTNLRQLVRMGLTRLASGRWTLTQPAPVNP